jgi:hypothetical protein
VLDFSHANVSFNSYAVPTVIGGPCTNQLPQVRTERFTPLRELALARLHYFLSGVNLEQIVRAAQSLHQQSHDMDGKVGRLLDEKLKASLIDRHKFAIGAGNG